MRAVIKSLLGRQDGRGALLGVLIAGLFLGYFVWYTFYDFVPRNYAVSWQASWITYPDEVISQSYYRKKIYLSQDIRHGWIRVMAPDNFKLYVNDRLLGATTSITQNATGYYDISGVLKAGTNVVAVSTLRTTYPGTSKVAVEGYYEDWQGIGHRIASDDSWRTNRYGEFQKSGGPEWFETSFEDINWIYAKAVGVPTAEDRSQVTTNPLDFTEKFVGNWVWGDAMESQKAYLRHSFTLGSMPEDARIKLAAQGYHLIVNGVPIAEKQKLLGITGDEKLSQLALDVYHIAPYLKRGKNTIAISAVAEHSTQGVLVDGFVQEKNGKLLRIATPAGWKAASTEVDRWTLPGFDDSHWAPAALKATLPVGDKLAKSLTEPIPPESYKLLLYGKKAFCMVGTALLVIISWILVALLFARVRAIDLVSSLTWTSLFYGLPLLFLVAVYLIGYDLRYDLAFPFQQQFLWIDLAIFLFVLLIAFIGRGIRAVRLPAVLWNFRYREIVAIGLLALVGFYFRFQEIDYKPLGGDETTMALVTREVADKGYPVISTSASLKQRFFTTSEFVPYYFALSMRIFSTKSIEFQIRFANVVFGSMTIILIFFMGKVLFSTRVGWLAAIIYTLLPLGINMSQFARYPQSVQFFVLLSAYGLYRGILTEPLNRRYVWLGGIANIFTYMSWEGSALYFPGLGIALIGVRGKDLRWAKDKHLWLAVLGLALVVYFQLGYRFTINRGLDAIGSGISDLTPTMRWDQPLYEPFGFIENFLFMKNVLLLTLIAALGLPLIFRSKPFFYCACHVIFPLLVTTNLIEVQDFRHVYYTLPFAILAASRTFLGILNYWFTPPDSSAFRQTPYLAGACAKFGFVLLLITTSNDYLLKLYNIPGVHAAGQTILELGDDGGVRSVSKLLKKERLPEDRVVPIFPHMLYIYYGSGSHYAENPLQIQVLIAEDAERAVHRITADPLIYSGEEWMDLIAKNRRVWLVMLTPISSNSFSLNLVPKLFDTMKEKMKLVFEDVGTFVYLLEQ